jgi:hypothetical protein
MLRSFLRWPFPFIGTLLVIVGSDPSFINSYYEPSSFPCYTDDLDQGNNAANATCSQFNRPLAKCDTFNLDFSASHIKNNAINYESLQSYLDTVDENLSVTRIRIVIEIEGNIHLSDQSKRTHSLFKHQ